MKKGMRTCMLGLLGALCLMLGACNSLPEIDPAAALQTMETSIPFSEELTEMDIAATCKNYDVDEADLQTGLSAIGSGATAESAAVFQAVDSEAAGRVETALRDFLDAWIEGYSDYQPEEVPKLAAAVLERRGPYVILCVSADAAKAAEVVGQILG